VAAAAALAAPRASAVRGAESLRSSREFRNAFAGGQRGWPRSTATIAVDLAHPLPALQDLSQKTRGLITKAHTCEDDDARPDAPPAPFPSMMLFRRRAAPQAQADERRARPQRGGLGLAASVSAAAAPSRMMRALTA
jgi:hypothetical protein